MCKKYECRFQAQGWSQMMAEDAGWCAGLGGTTCNVFLCNRYNISPGSRRAARMAGTSRQRHA